MQGYKHDICVTTKAKVVGSKVVDGDKMVSMANNSDPFYGCDFETRQEIDEFIKELKEARNKAFPIEEKREELT